MNEKHEHGPLKMDGDTIIDIFGNIIDTPAVVIDLCDEPNALATMHAYGSEDKVTFRYQTMCGAFHTIGAHDMENDLRMITFHAVTGFPDYDKSQNAIFTKDEICTVINWLHNVIPVKQFKELMTMPIEQARQKLANLAACGF